MVANVVRNTNQMARAGVTGGEGLGVVAGEGRDTGDQTQTSRQRKTNNEPNERANTNNKQTNQGGVFQTKGTCSRHRMWLQQDVGSHRFPSTIRRAMLFEQETGMI